ncbi:hypothetical protein SK128_004980 [Halocaridina rubra]|uniref:Lipocalin/cytosolic fatty-acid binding domain-containing protein n=1 Tax=Halocaridina rubra TaxID=373956 RepID=A0AAN9A110_HALRR
MKTVTFVIVLFSLSQAQEIEPEGCPEFTPKTDFEIPPYLGKWIEIARFVTPEQAGQTCNYAEYSDNGDGTVGVHNAGLEADGSFTEIFGYVEPTEVPGALILHLDGVPVSGSYNVLATDYETYTSVYSCVGILGIGHVEQAWILARNSTLAQEDLDTALAGFSKWGIDTTKFTYTSQDACSYP